MKNVGRKKRNIIGTAERLRLAVCRTLNNISAQVINDENGTTVAAASSAEKGLLKSGGNIAAAQKIGQLVAERALAKGVKKVVFDRGGDRYHGRIKALADAARQGGLDF
jgi:large subunit ribosomal protein L18